MTVALVIIIGIVIIVFFSSKAKKQEPVRQPYPGKKSYSPIEISIQTFSQNSCSRSVDPPKDESIIEVTGSPYEIKKQGLTKYERGVTYWRHQYVYSYSEISGATKEQRDFYNYFKYRFLKGEYIDVEGNSNYPFILLFDLLDNDFKSHQNLKTLESQLDELGYYYPKTSSYAKNFLVRKFRFFGDNAGADRIEGKQSSYYNYQEPDYYWGLGGKYKTKLGLKEEEVKLLNLVNFPSNNFCSVEFCEISVARLFLLYIENLKAKFQESGSSFEYETTELVDLILRKHHGFKSGSANYKYMVEPVSREVYSYIFKNCENAVRECYAHKRKLNADIPYTNLELKTEFELRVVNKINEILPLLISGIEMPDMPTEIELNAQNTSRWKLKSDTIFEKYGNNPKDFYEQIVSLGTLNNKNPSLENIFFEASKYISKKDKEISLSLYVHYLYYDLKSVNFDNRQFAKTIQKALFKTNEQLHDFEKLVSELIQNKNLDSALDKVKKIYEVKRRKIKLDDVSIKEVQQQHSGTVELLDKYLKDDYEDEVTSIHSQQISSDELTIEIVSKTIEKQSSIYIDTISFSPIHLATLEIFIKNGLSVPQEDVEQFAQPQGIFKNQLIENINDICYETLDDLLIEEDEDYYVINKDYYQKLLSK